MNKRQSQRIYNIKQREDAASGISVAQSRSMTEIATEKSLTQFDYFRSKTTTPSGRFYKNGWLQSHKLQQGVLKESKTPSLLFIGDSIAYGFKCYPHIWEQYDSRGYQDQFYTFFTRKFYKHKKHKKHKNVKQANKNKKGNNFYAHKKHLRGRKSLV